jgi:hypothetical protein
LYVVCISNDLLFHLPTHLLSVPGQRDGPQA